MSGILFINGSPRRSRSCSALVLKDLAGVMKEEGVLEEEPEVITPSRKLPADPQDVLEKLEEADIWVMALPLYVDTLPGHLTWWLRQYELYRQRTGTRKEIRVYAVVNCGFPEPEQNADALEMLEIYCGKNGLSWRLGIGLGMGEPYKEMAGIPLKSRFKSAIYDSCRTAAEDIRAAGDGPAANRFVKVRFPRFLYTFMGSIGWRQQARKNGLKRGDLYARPLQKW